MGDKVERYTTVKEMRFRSRASSGTVVVAKNVVLFQIDSLEGDAVGTAILFKEWEVVKQ